MKVIMVAHAFQEHYAIGFANGVASKGITVDFLCSDKQNPQLLSPSISWRNLGENTRSDRPLWDKLVRFVGYHSRLIYYIFLNRNSIIHVISSLRNEIVTGVIEGALFRILGNRYILTIHNVLPHDQHTPAKRLLYRIIYKFPHHLIVHTEKMKRELTQSFGIAADKIVVMQHGLNDIVPDHGRSSDECRQILGLPENACVLLFFGWLRPYKGLETLLEAFRKLGDQFFLVIAGTAHQASYGQKIRNLIASHPARDRILLRMEYIDNQDIETYFRAANALVMPYKHIDQSGIIFLAFRFGLPVVAFNVGAFQEYTNQDIGILIDGDQPEDLIAGINSFFENRGRFSAATIQNHSRKFLWANTLPPVIKLYRC